MKVMRRTGRGAGTMSGGNQNLVLNKSCMQPAHAGSKGQMLLGSPREAQSYGRVKYSRRLEKRTNEKCGGHRVMDG